MSAREVLIYTDGGCRGNPGPGAWAAILSFPDGDKEVSGFEAQTTNNRMELTAAIEGLRCLPYPSKTRVFTDSEYLRRGITEWLEVWIAQGWRTAAKKAVKNQDLWKELQKLVSRHDVEWCWVRGHSGHRQNTRCDALVNETMDEHLAER